MKPTASRGRFRALCTGMVGIAITVAPPAFAQSTVFKTRRSASSTWNSVLPLTLGFGVDFEHSSDGKETAFPLLVEYNFTQRFRVAAESNGTFVNSNDADVGRISGFDDLETSIEYEALRERRYTPALTAVGLIKWPTDNIGSPGTDYTVGLTASKDVVYFDVDSTVIYTFSGDPEAPNLLEASLAAAYPLNYKFELQAEIVHVIGTSGPDRSDAKETEGTVGFAWQITPFHSLEQGFLRKDDGTWGVLVGWQYSFGGE